MIVFETANRSINLTDKVTTFNESSEYFAARQSKSFSYPFNVLLNEDLAADLGLINIESVNSYNSRIYGNLIIDRVYYEAYISINEIKGARAELTLFYGKETLTVFDKKLKDLYWPTISVTDLPDHAKSLLDLSWPQTTHNFPKVYRPQLSEKANYLLFDNFVNNYVDNEGTWEFPVNSVDVIDGENVIVNRNVMAPMPYLLEIVRTIFAAAGLNIGGEFVNDDLIKNIVLVPKNFFEQYAGTDFLNYSFSYFNSTETINNESIGVYTQTHSPDTEGTYKLNFNINLSSSMARYFHLEIKKGPTTIYNASSTNQSVNINETLNINYVNTTVFDTITVTLKLSFQLNSIASFNSFKYEFIESDLNVFPTSYSLAYFMPNITAREFINRVKAWLNLSLDYTENTVYINYLNNLQDNLIFRDKTHLQDTEPIRVLIENNLFKLSYPDNQMVMVNKNGQTYNESNYLDSETVDLEIEALPLDVSYNHGSVTAVYPEEENDLMFVLFNGTIDDENITVDSINNRSLKLQSIFEDFWNKWLKFRANAEIYKDSFYLHVTEEFKIKEGIFKYNKKHLVRTIKKKRVNKEYWKVDVESETF